MFPECYKGILLLLTTLNIFKYLNLEGMVIFLKFSPFNFQARYFYPLYHVTAVSVNIHFYSLNQGFPKHILQHLKGSWHTHRGVMRCPWAPVPPGAIILDLVKFHEIPGGGAVVTVSRFGCSILDLTKSAGKKRLQGHCDPGKFGNHCLKYSIFLLKFKVPFLIKKRNVTISFKL